MVQVAFIPLPDYQEQSLEEMDHRAAEFYDDLRRRRTVREFSDQPVPVEVIKDCVRPALLLTARTCSRGTLSSSAMRRSNKDSRRGFRSDTAH